MRAHHVHNKNNLINSSQHTLFAGLSAINLQSEERPDPFLCPMAQAGSDNQEPSCGAQENFAFLKYADQDPEPARHGLDHAGGMQCLPPALTCEVKKQQGDIERG